MKKFIVFGIILMCVLLAGCETEQPIGGETDEHGCMLMAGYTWCESKQKCLRTWEEGCPGEDELVCESDDDCIPLPSDCHPLICINKAYESNYKKPEICTATFLEEAAYNPEDCICSEGNCVNKNKPKAPPLEEPVEETSLSPGECIEKGGRTVNIVGGDSCNEDELNIGEVVGFISPNICCIPRKDEKMTVEEAIEIAKNSGCIEKGQLTDKSFYNKYTDTWWIDLDIKEEFKKEYCSPACVVKEATKTASINWRCTGVLPPTK